MISIHSECVQMKMSDILPGIYLFGNGITKSEKRSSFKILLQPLLVPSQKS